MGMSVSYLKKASNESCCNCDCPTYTAHHMLCIFLSSEYISRVIPTHLVLWTELAIEYGQEIHRPDDAILTVIETKTSITICASYNFMGTGTPFERKRIIVWEPGPRNT
ncbi:hypothetical protein CSV74_07525 [Sporosarcina sp. P19]|nr:hypothetical protein CSV74_07525 [Sporosarcina sp. P19]